jgi:hypothetical protein
MALRRSISATVRRNISVSSASTVSGGDSTSILRRRKSSRRNLCFLALYSAVTSQGIGAFASTYHNRQQQQQQHRSIMSCSATHVTERDGSGTITVSPKNEADQSGLVVIAHGLGDTAEGTSSFFLRISYAIQFFGTTLFEESK